jgi:tetratricopeptide (TPR) repeat protein
VEDQERSIEIARASNSADVIRSLGNLASCRLDMGQLARARETLDQAIVEAQRFGSVWYRDWLGPERVIHLYYEGAWDEAVRLTDELISEVERGLTTFMEGANRTARAKIQLARGDTEGALEESARAVELARGAKNPQLLHAALAADAAQWAELGRLDEAAEAVEDLLADWRMHPILSSAFWLVDLAYALVPLGRAGELAGVLAGVQTETAWGEAASAYASGDHPAAAEVLDRAGALPEAAYVRLRSGSDAEVRRALDFYRSVGAARYVSEGERLLAQTA